MLRQHVQSSPPPRKTFARARLVPRMGKPPVAQVRATDREREVRLPRRRIPHVTPRSPPSRDDSTDVLLVVTLSHHHARHPFSPAAPPRCDLVRASRTRVRQVHVTQRGPARGVRPGLRAVARADGRHASGRSGAGRRGRRRNHPAGQGKKNEPIRGPIRLRLAEKRDARRETEDASVGTFEPSVEGDETVKGGVTCVGRTPDTTKAHRRVRKGIIPHDAKRRKTRRDA